MKTTTLDNPRKEILSSLENLIEITRDGQEGFSQAAENAKAPELRDTFRQYSVERSVMVTELQNLERQCGKAEVDDSGTVTGSLHRAWINLRTAIASSNDQAILEEAERGEDAAVAAYREALKQNNPPLPRSVTSVLESHLIRIQAAHDDVRNRRDSGKYTPQDY